MKIHYERKGKSVFRWWWRITVSWYRKGIYYQWNPYRQHWKAGGQFSLWEAIKQEFKTPSIYPRL